MRAAAALMPLVLAFGVMCPATPGPARAQQNSAASGAAQPNVPANPKRDGSGMDLADAMKLIEARLSGIGKIEFIAYATDDRGYTAMKRISHQWSEVAADAGACRIRYRWKASSDGQVFQDSSHELSLKEVEQVDVVTGEEAFQADLARAGRRELKARVEPAVFVLEARRPAAPGSRGLVDSFFFGDEETAKAVAGAMRRAVELCSPGARSEN